VYQIQWTSSLGESLLHSWLSEPVCPRVEGYKAAWLLLGRDRGNWTPKSRSSTPIKDMPESDRWSLPRNHGYECQVGCGPCAEALKCRHVFGSESKVRWVDVTMNWDRSSSFEANACPLQDTPL
jgi:hypothetical protein